MVILKLVNLFHCRLFDIMKRSKKNTPNWRWILIFVFLMIKSFLFTQSIIALKWSPRTLKHKWLEPICSQVIAWISSHFRSCLLKKSYQESYISTHLFSIKKKKRANECFNFHSYWERQTEYTPESRIETHENMKKKRERESKEFVF